MIKDPSKQNRIVDEIQLKIRNGKVSSATYFNDTKKLNEDNIRFINDNSVLTDLNNNHLILFMTSKQGENVEFAYGYKLKPMSVDNPHIQNLLSFFGKNTREQIIYFSQKISRGDYSSEGVYFIGDELRKNNERIKKIYFRCALENRGNGDILHDLEIIDSLLDNSKIKELIKIRDKTRFLLKRNFNYDMIAWNEYCSNETLGYKLYYIGKENEYAETINELVERVGITIDKAALDEELGKAKGLYLAHISYSISTDGKEELNLYFKG